MVKHIFLGFRWGKLETVVISNADDIETAVECDYFVDRPQKPKTQVKEWLGDEAWK